MNDADSDDSNCNHICTTNDDETILFANSDNNHDYVINHKYDISNNDDYYYHNKNGIQTDENYWNDNTNNNNSYENNNTRI